MNIASALCVEALYVSEAACLEKYLVGKKRQRSWSALACESQIRWGRELLSMTRV